jgi:hypothetical protein
VGVFLGGGGFGGGGGGGGGGGCPLVEALQGTGRADDNCHCQSTPSPPFTP